MITHSSSHRLPLQVGESLPAAAKRTLNHLDPTVLAQLIDDTSKGNHSICRGNASAWASTFLHEMHSIMNPYGAGWHLDRALFDETLRISCGSILQKGRFVAVRRFGSNSNNTGATGRIEFGWEIDVEMGAVGTAETFRAKWLVDATGRKASLAQKVSTMVCSSPRPKWHL